MEMTSNKRIEANTEKIWNALNDTEVLKASMPGCESFEVTGENTFQAKLTAKVGPVKARFTFKVNLTDIDAPNGYTINGEGNGGAAGFARGSATVKLAEDDGATMLSYSVKANVGGKLAQLGGRLIDGAARKIADEFFGNFIEIVAGGTQGPDQTVTTDSSASQEIVGLPTWVWIIGIVLAGAAVLFTFA